MMSAETSESSKELNFQVETSWIREWLLLETSVSNTGVILNCALFDLENMSLDSSQQNLEMSEPITSTSTSRGQLNQGGFGNNMNSNLSSFFSSFKLYAKALEVDLQIKRKYLNKYCKTLSHFLNDQGITSGLIEFPNDIMEENGYQLVKLLEFFGGSLNLNIIQQDNLFDHLNDSIAETKMPAFRSKTKQNSNNVLYDSKGVLNKKINSQKEMNAGITKENNTQRVMKQHAWLNKLLNYLKNFGMHLNSIRPEFLLSYQDLIVYWKIKDSKKVFVKKYKLSHQQYNLLNKYAWCTLFFQIIKVFYFIPNLRPKKSFFEIGNYITPAFENKFKLESKKKYFSESENLLIFWLSSAFDQIFNKEIRFSSFRDLRTSTIIASVIGRNN